MSGDAPTPPPDRTEHTNETMVDLMCTMLVFATMQAARHECAQIALRHGSFAGREIADKINALIEKDRLDEIARKAFRLTLQEDSGKASGT